MKYILPFILIIIAGLDISAQNKFIKASGKYQNDQKSEKLNGKVKSHTRYFYDLTKADVSSRSNWRYKSKVNFNKNGNITD
jgi:hypothetical protein